MSAPEPPSCQCPFLARYRPLGREHVYELCEAPGEGPFVPTCAELATLCLGRFGLCSRFLAAAASGCRLPQHQGSVPYQGPGHAAGEAVKPAA